MKTSKLNRVSVNRCDDFAAGWSDYIAADLREQFNENPLGRLLGIIVSLPEVRPEKLTRGRSIVRRENSDLNTQLDAAIDKVLEDILTDNIG